jgi:menaquinone-dependent protoporphyrinogen IX oxidase
MKAIVLFDTLYGNTERIAAACLAKEMGLHYNEI